MNTALGTVPVWQPLRPLGRARVDRDAVERQAAAQGQPPLRWPPASAQELETATLAAAFAQASGRAVAFSLAALRQAFLAGRDLSVTDNVLIAAAACELHPRALLKGIESRAVRGRLAAADREAARLGVSELPAVAAGERVVQGPDCVERAVALMPLARARGMD